MSKKADWQRWEITVNDQLGLEGTVASGATWKDKGDGSTRSGDVWPLLVDAKTTEAASYSLKFKFLDDLWKMAVQSGKSVALPLKFLGRKGETEWVVAPFSDYAYLVEQYRKGNGEFTDEERELIRSIASTLKNEEFKKMALRILSKMGDEA